MPVSPDTLLRLVCHNDFPPAATPTVLGVDDWAWKKGQTYGTILVDLEQQRVVDLLPDRSADSLVEWLQQHPGVQIISRDRGGIYAEGARCGAPDAEQVADRFHLLKNLREALEPLLSREHAHLPKIVIPATKSPAALPTAPQAEPAAASTIGPAMAGNDVPVDQAGCIVPELAAPSATAESHLPKLQTRTEQIKHDRRERRQARYQEIIALRDQDISIRSIAQQMGMGRQTVRRYIEAGTFPEIAERRQMPTILGKFEPYLRQCWYEGQHNATQLYREIREQGYPGSRSLVSRWAAQIRKAAPEPAHPDTIATTRTPRQPQDHPPENRRKLAPSQAAWLLVCKPDDLKPEQKTALAQMRQASTQIALAYNLAQAFAGMVRDHKAESLTSWLESAKDCCLKELRSFANGIQRDLAAVTAGLSSPWSNGQVEGQVNRLKLLKRSMYGRAKFDLLKHRVLAPT